MQDTLNLVLVILSIGTIIGPVFFGFVIWKLMSIFVTKQQFDDYKILASTERDFMKGSLQRIEKKLDDKLA